MQLGLTVNEMPAIANSEELLNLPSLQHPSQLLLVKGIGGRTLLAETLAARGSTLMTLDVYQRDLPPVSQSILTQLWQDNTVDIILITSHQALLQIMTLFGSQAKSWLCEK